MQKARRHPPEDGLRPLVSTRFQVLLTTLVGILFNIRSPYWFAIGRRGVFSLAGWTPQLHTEFHGLRATLECLGRLLSTLQDCHLLWLAFQDHLRIHWPYHIGIRNPAPKGGLGCSGFARRYSRNRGFFIFLWLLRCFSSPGSPPCPMHSGMDIRPKADGFPHSEIPGSQLGCQLPWAYRRLQRPSSPLDAKSSTARP